MAQWQKGQSGNPGGRPAGYGEIRDIARLHTDEAIQTLVTVMNDSKAPPSARVGAATAVLDRGWGRPLQSINASVDANRVTVSDTLDLSIQDLMKQIRETENTRETEDKPSTPPSTAPGTH